MAKKKTVLVLPPDEMICQPGDMFAFYPGDGIQPVWANHPAFPLICIGLWEMLWHKIKGNENESKIETYKKNWHDLANGTINLSDCRFRRMTRTKRKELGL